MPLAEGFRCYIDAVNRVPRCESFSQLIDAPAEFTCIVTHEATIEEGLGILQGLDSQIPGKLH